MKTKPPLKQITQFPFSFVTLWDWAGPQEDITTVGSISGRPSLEPCLLDRHSEVRGRGERADGTEVMYYGWVKAMLWGASWGPIQSGTDWPSQTRHTLTLSKAPPPTPQRLWAAWTRHDPGHRSSTTDKYMWESVLCDETLSWKLPKH